MIHFMFDNKSDSTRSVRDLKSQKCFKDYRDKKNNGDKGKKIWMDNINSDKNIKYSLEMYI